MEKLLSVSGNLNASINFAMQQNYVPVIRNLVVHNESAEMLENLELKISFDPDFAREYTGHIDSIAPGGAVEITPVKIQTRTEFLFSLTEKMVGTITVDVFCGEEKIFTWANDIELLAFDEWSGLRIMPEIIAAFITPNHPVIAHVVQEASAFLRKWTGNPSFTGYQTQNPNQVKLQMAALYTALQTQGIVYNNPPASYEAVGQRVRLPHTVLEQKQGTCLDLAVLYAACLEAVGLYPLLVFLEGHAFCACWLEENTFADCVVDDVSAIEKRVASGAEELLLVECTDMVAGNSVDFDHAAKHGKDHLNAPENFVCAVDVRRTRGSGIHPIPLRLDAPQAQAQPAPQEKEAVNAGAPARLDTSLLGRVAQGDDRPMTKEKLWERKLLDFSLRNALLNFRVTKNALQFITSDLAELEDRLSDGKDFRVMEAPAEWTVSMRDARMFAIENDRDLIKTIATEEFRSNRIRTFLPEKELDAALKNLYRSARMSMEENGSNTLFLALGFLRWYESDLSEKARYAPIVLIPVDIVRSVRNGGYIIRSRQEDPQVNVTLLEYLRQDHGISIGGIDPLPQDEHGVDLPLVFNTVRQAVMSKKRWNVEELAFVGLFSFGQFVMWNDLRARADELRRNKVVASLMEGRLTWTPEEIAVTPHALDTGVSMQEMAVPVSADSSQLAAVAAAAAGQSFVLHGPPGTGKSQTITNMIANALYNGKTVLFVAEKMAALNVVQKRLADIGLDPFCLELHSNKTNKSSVLAELNKALEVGRIKPPEEYAAAAEELGALRTQLNHIIEALHERRDCGVSLYEAITIYEQNAAEQGKINFERTETTGLPRETIRHWEELLRRYAVAAAEVGIYAEHPLRGVGLRAYSMETREAFRTAVGALLEKLPGAKADAEALAGWLNATPKRDRASMEALVRVADALEGAGVLLPELLTLPGFDGAVTAIRQLVQTGRDWAGQYAELNARFEPAVFDYPVQEACLRWKKAETAWFLPKMTEQGKLVKELKLYAKNPSSVTKENIEGLYERLSLLAQRKKTLGEVPPQISGLLSGLFLGTQTDWNAVEAALAKTEAVRTACLTIPGGGVEAMQAVCGAEPSQDTKAEKERLTAFVCALDDCTRTFALDLSAEEAAPCWLDAADARLKLFQSHLEQLRDMVAFTQADDALCGAGLENVSRAFRTGAVTAQNLEAAWACGLYYVLTLRIINADPRLKDFHGKTCDDTILRYRAAIENYQKLTVQELVARLSAKIPASGTAGAATSEMGILKRAIKSNGRMLSLRRLFDQIPTLLRKLCPCMLMSPISVAQYIDPAFPKFDLVIFDEASQLPTSEAVGTIARGENVVVVGDPKQLPPTDFFSSNRIDEENSDKEDLESLLDDCLAISMPQEHLKWHYRSRHESLIAYSNMKYYDNRLYTFPSPGDLVSAVKMVHLDGCYDKGKTKQNRAEARAIVDEIIRRLSDETLRGDSIGVVTFSSVQQNLIDDMLCEEWAKHPELEELDHNAHEPVFIKNLENVQGDERDVILFSVGYGPDQNGAVSMNFGPLNRDGGWRRLNVAISRARKAMVVYSVLRPEQIDLSRSRAEGVAGLKGFLEFAERGSAAIARRADIAQATPDALVEQIAAAIGQMGYQVKCGVGCSAFRMDMGVVDPENPDTYLLGILLDGENSRAATTARDRFVLQPSVLTGLGWNILRLWTLDWLDDKDRVLRGVKAAIDAIPPRAEPQTVAVKPETFAGFAFEKQETREVSAAKPYASAHLAARGSAEDFYDPKNRIVVQSAAAQIIREEAPISRKLLMKKVLSAWGITRGGSRVESIFLDALKGLPIKTTTDEGRVFVWENDQDPAAYEGYRLQDRDGGKRSMDDVPAEEIHNAMTEVLREQISLSEVDLVRETARKFGFSRMGGVIESTVRYAVGRAILAKLVRRGENGNISLPE